MMGRKKKTQRGFTLAEMLVTTSLITIVAGTAVSTFVGASRVWKQVECQGFGQQNIQIAFENLRQGMRNYQAFEPIEFEGKTSQVSFPARNFMENELDAPVYEIVRRGYYVDTRSKKLCRSEEPYRTMKRDRLKSECTEIADNIERIKFSYYGFNPNSKKYDSRSNWEREGLPLAIEATLYYQDACTEKREKKSFRFTLPQGTVG